MPTGSPAQDERRVEIEELRAEVGGTVEELTRRLDIPARTRERRTEVTAQAQVRVTRAWGAAAQRVRALQCSGPPSVQAVAATLLAVGVVRRARRS